MTYVLCSVDNEINMGYNNSNKHRYRDNVALKKTPITFREEQDLWRDLQISGRPSSKSYVNISNVIVGVDIYKTRVYVRQDLFRIHIFIKRDELYSCRNHVHNEIQTWRTTIILQETQPIRTRVCIYTPMLVWDWSNEYHLQHTTCKVNNWRRYSSCKTTVHSTNI